MRTLIIDNFEYRSYGLPMMIDLADCDRLFPSIHEHHPSADPVYADSSATPYLLNHWMLSLTIILGKVIKLLYSAGMARGILD
jgi:hypothetical protein